MNTLRTMPLLIVCIAMSNSIAISCSAQDVLNKLWNARYGRAVLVVGSEQAGYDSPILKSTLLGIVASLDSIIDQKQDYIQAAQAGAIYGMANVGVRFVDHQAAEYGLDTHQIAKRLRRILPEGLIRDIAQQLTPVAREVLYDWITCAIICALSKITQGN